ncbi:Ras-related protein RABC1 [Morella rubra]|uniref:Ras-related protein RABC1 n=1 Tax=Morella rubra TaxID=262757 RepID=A0A6A1WA34_9ROSI|nr:Ras-related protein RABC1 [Morella rubra]
MEATLRDHREEQRVEQERIRLEQEERMKKGARAHASGARGAYTTGTRAHVKGTRALTGRNIKAREENVLCNGEENERHVKALFSQFGGSKGVDFKVKHATIGGKKLRLIVCDTVYYITRRENFTNLSDIWAKEIDLYSTNQDCVKILVGNKIDKYCSICHVGSIISRKDVRHGEVNLSFQESERVVSKREGIDFARQNGYLFMECSAKTGVNEEKCFEQLVDKILEIPSLMAGTAGVKKSILKLEAPQSDASTSAKHRISSGCCS